MSGEKLAKEYAGDPRKFKSLIKEYALSKAQELEATGMSAQEAADEVFQSYAGIYANIHGESVWFINPLAVDEKKAQWKLVKQQNRPPKAESGWMSGNMMQNKYGSYTDKYNELIENYAVSKVQELEAKGKSVEEAKNEVFKLYAGIYTGTNGKPCWFISLSGIDEVRESWGLQQKATEDEKIATSSGKRESLKAKRPERSASPAHKTLEQRTEEKNTKRGLGK